MPWYLYQGIFSSIIPNLLFPFMIRKPAKIHYILSILALSYLSGNNQFRNLTFTTAHAPGELVVYSPLIN